MKQQWWTSLAGMMIVGGLASTTWGQSTPPRKQDQRPPAPTSAKPRAKAAKTPTTVRSAPAQPRSDGAATVRPRIQPPRRSPLKPPPARPSLRPAQPVARIAPGKLTSQKSTMPSTPAAGASGKTGASAARGLANDVAQGAAEGAAGRAVPLFSEFKYFVKSIFGATPAARANADRAEQRLLAIADGESVPSGMTLGGVSTYRVQNSQFPTEVKNQAIQNFPDYAKGKAIKYGVGNLFPDASPEVRGGLKGGLSNLLRAKPATPVVVQPNLVSGGSSPPPSSLTGAKPPNAAGPPRYNPGSRKWLCNAYQCYHDDPGECSDPSKGGQWITRY